MALDVIYVTRHGFRSNWLVDPVTGKYTATIRSPTGIATDPALTAHGLDQARELGRHLLAVDPPIERVYSSPYYRCLQTIEPFARAAQAGGSVEHVPPTPGPGQQPHQDAGQQLLKVRVEPGLGEWFGTAPFEHPSPAPSDVLGRLFPGMLAGAYQAELVPPSRGESMEALHERVAEAAARIIRRCDDEGARSVVMCTHAAAVIALGRVLTGQMPADVVGADDFGAFTCGLSVYRRRKATATARTKTADGQEAAAVAVAPAESAAPDSPATAAKLQETPKDAPLAQARKLSSLPTGQAAQDEARQQHRGKSAGSSDAAPAYETQEPRNRVSSWMGGRGVGGGWVCESNSDCSFLSGGCERGWSFAGDEAFPDAPAAGPADYPGEKRSTRL